MDKLFKRAKLNGKGFQYWKFIDIYKNEWQDENAIFVCFDFDEFSLEMTPMDSFEYYKGHMELLPIPNEEFLENVRGEVPNTLEDINRLGIC